MNKRTDLTLIERVSKELRDYLGEDFDDETFLDTLDGETDAMDLLGALIIEREEAKAMAGASKELADTYTIRKRRMEQKQKGIAAAMGALLDAIGERKIAHPIGTVSRTKGRTSCEITDENAIPSQLTVTTVRPDTMAIKKQLDAGEAVPGAQLIVGPQGVTVRVK